MITQQYEALESAIGYHFKNTMHLTIALTHKSYTNEIMCGHKESYERYEFLGDAILEYLVSRFLFRNYPEKTEGELTKMRASLVCEFTLSKISRELKLGEYAYFSKGERNTGGANRDSILCDMFESLLGAIFLDGGIEMANAFVERLLLTDIEHKQLFYDSKSKLQEYAQKQDRQVCYELLDETGPEHDKEFQVQVRLGNKILAKGFGHSRKSAEQMAAYNALKIVG